MSPRPTVTVVMANFRGARHIRAALKSVQDQSLQNLEVIVADDCSDDDSVSIVEAIGATDKRVRLITAKANGGPGRARNLALDQARGEWVAIVDSDDVIHPDRLRRLIDLAISHNADGVADDLLFFTDGTAGGVSTLLWDEVAKIPWWLSPERFVACNVLGSDNATLGYLKPIIRRSKLADLRYDETIRIGEDYDFLLRYLARGMRVLVTPEPLYLYRRHLSSISHRLNVAAVEAMIANQEAFSRENTRPSAELAEALRMRMDALHQAAAFERLVSAIKERRPVEAASILYSHPACFRALLISARQGLGRRLAPKATASALAPQAIAVGRDPEGRLQLEAVCRAFGEARNWHFAATTGWESATGDLNVSRRGALDFAALFALQTQKVVAIGQDGLYAAGFMPAGTLIGTVAVNTDDVSAMWSMPALRRVPLLVPADIWAQSGLDASALAVDGGHVLVTRQAQFTGQTAIGK